MQSVSLRLFSLLICCFFSLHLSAQLQKGDQLWLFEAASDAFSLPLRADLGVLATSVESDGQFALVLSPEVSFLLSDRIAVGGGLGVAASFGEFSASDWQLAPHFRYYFVNNASSQLFGGLKGVLAFGDNRDGLDVGITPQVGWSTPLVPGVLLNPNLQYQIQNGTNRLVLGLGTQIQMGRNNRPESPVSASLAKGNKLVGVSLGNIFLEGGSRGFTSINLSPDLLFMLGNRFAIGPALALSGSFRENVSVSSATIGANARFFLANDKRTLPFLQFGASYVTSSVEFDGVESSDNSFLVDGIAGLDVFVRENVALETGLGVRVAEEDVLIGAILGVRFLWR